MKRIFFLASLMLLVSLSTQAQEKSKLSTQPNKVKVKTVDETKKYQPVLKTSSSSSVNKSTNIIKNHSILEELYAIEDTRNKIEKDESLSTEIKRAKIQENNIQYNSKKMEFVSYVNSRGVLNVTKQEQSYFLSILKNDKKDKEYKQNITIIKNSK